MIFASHRALSWYVSKELYPLSQRNIKLRFTTVRKNTHNMFLFLVIHLYDVPDVFCHLYDIAIASMPKFACSSYYSHWCISLDIFGRTSNKSFIPSSQFWSRWCFFIVYRGIIIERSMNAPFESPRIHLQAYVSAYWRSLYTVICLSIGCIFFYSP